MVVHIHVHTGIDHVISIMVTAAEISIDSIATTLIDEKMGEFL